MFSIADSLPHTVNHGNNFFPYTVRSAAYIEQMGNADQKSVLWTNIAALMRHHYGKENINQLHKESKVSLAIFTRQRMRGLRFNIADTARQPDGCTPEKDAPKLGRLHPTDKPPLRRFFVAYAPPRK